ncbi:endonuclease/exonuclease/phosphatase family protein [Sphaerospermopsis aphanizomenoides]|uniref:endonuclease/exonuclease/phosphatase family protein n=1 Tax=Sphaerospermopsis aphanizomenoides TaxID=459663 RepID=UPI001F17D0C5|nr:endonuclease/exonuclease/phosphatase family protein [Sphaerospermopsis aphanizomenoides]
MSFNLRCDKPDPGIRQWEKRVSAIASVIKHYQPDLIGTQEGKPHQLSDLQALLPEYKFIGGDRTGTGQCEHCAVFYNPQILELQQTKDFYLSDTPEIPGSITWETRLPRMATWANFTVGNPSISLTIVNTHLDHEIAKARELGAGLISLRLMEFPAEDYLLLTGDFNANSRTLERIILADNYRIQDALTNVPWEQQKTFHDFTGEPVDARDTIYCDRRFHIEQVIIDNQQWEGIWPSDHFPVIVKLKIGNRE